MSTTVTWVHSEMLREREFKKEGESYMWPLCKGIDNCQLDVTHSQINLFFFLGGGGRDRIK